ncbi:MAG: peptidoglycan DD-metalloendopeptidase family protein [Clostridium perfringens]|nr:peptidoglycan DD-metalloendopeptidase family protein [Clostridium perfringens]
MKRTRITALVLSLIIGNVAILPTGIQVQAKTSEEVQQEIEENQSKIDSLDEEKQSLEEEKSEVQVKLDEIKAQLDEKNQLLNESQNKVNELNSKISDLEETINNVNNEISSIENDIRLKEVEITEKEEILGQRLRGVYKNSIGNEILNLILSSNSLGDIISVLSNVKVLVKTDTELINEVVQMKEDLQNQKTDLENKKSQVQQDKSDLESTKIEFDKVREEYQNQVDELKVLEDERNYEISKLSDEQKAIQDEINKYEEDNADLREYFSNTSTAPSVASSGTTTNGTVISSNASGFIKPSGGAVTCYYGPRIHPVTGVYSTHTGVDFGASYGSAIVAAKSGVVTTATYNTAYGNMVIIDHGDGTSTLYAHASSFATSVGATVSQGQTIAYIGSTGYSTGPHLHFEIRINGQHVDPLPYL